MYYSCVHTLIIKIPQYKELSVESSLALTSSKVALSMSASAYEPLGLSSSPAMSSLVGEGGGFSCAGASFTSCFFSVGVSFFSFFWRLG